MSGKMGGREATEGVIPGRYCLSVGMPDLPAPEGWQWRPLLDLARLESGHTPSRKKPEYWGGDVPWIGIKDATGNNGATLDDTMQHTNDLGIENSAARILAENTVCLSRTASVGYVVVMGRPMATSQDFANWVCGPDLDHRFLKYVLLLENEALHRFSHGSTHKTIYYPELKAFHICLPPIEEQQRIAECLEILDRKITVNEAAAETLTALAKTVFSSWFVKFDPVWANIEGREMDHVSPETQELFPSGFGDDGLPAGWTERGLDEIATFLNGAALQKYPAIDQEDSIPVIKIAELRSGVTKKTGRASPNVPEKFHIQAGDILFSWSGTLMQTIWTGEDGALNQHLFKVSSTIAPRWFHFYAVEHHMNEFRAIAASKATTMGHIQRHHLADAKIAWPPEQLLSKADYILKPIFDGYCNKLIQCEDLRKTRDALLPELLSGRISPRHTCADAREAA